MKRLSLLLITFMIVSVTPGEAAPVVFNIEKAALHNTVIPDPAKRYARKHKHLMYKPCDYKILFIKFKRKKGCTS